MLTKRQREIVDLVTRGLTNQDIGRVLGITEGTVKVHLHAIYAKEEIANRAELVYVMLTSKEWNAT